MHSHWGLFRQESIRWLCHALRLKTRGVVWRWLTTVKMVINITNQTRFVVSRFLLKLVPSHCCSLFVRPHSTFAPEVNSNPKTPQSQEEHVAFGCLQSIKQTRLAWWLAHSLLKTVWSPSFVVWSLTNFKTTQPQHRKWIKRPKCLRSATSTYLIFYPFVLHLILQSVKLPRWALWWVRVLLKLVSSPPLHLPSIIPLLTLVLDRRFTPSDLCLIHWPELTKSFSHNTIKDIKDMLVIFFLFLLGKKKEEEEEEEEKKNK